MIFGQSILVLLIPHFKLNNSNTHKGRVFVTDSTVKFEYKYGVTWTIPLIDNNTIINIFPGARAYASAAFHSRDFYLFGGKTIIGGYSLGIPYLITILCSID